MPKMKSHRGAAQRFRVTKTGKLKRGHTLTSHLMSGRSAKKKRKLGRPALVAEGLAKNMRRLMGVAKLKPKKIEHERKLAAKRQAATAGAAAE